MWCLFLYDLHTDIFHSQSPVKMKSNSQKEYFLNSQKETYVITLFNQTHRRH
jgi:hypothetical protein